MSGAVLELEQASVAYGSQTVVRGASLTLARGELHAVLGASGSGKTTLLRAIAGFEPLARGCLRLLGRVADDGRTFLPPEQRRVGVVFQDYALFPHLDVAGNVAFGRRGMPAASVEALLERAGLGGYGRRQVGDLSGGEQQRVALCRALAQEPELILCDEPFSNLNRELRRTLRATTCEILRERGVAALLVTHDAEEALAVADRISVLHRGSLLQTGSPRELYLTPRTLEVAASLGDVIALPARSVAAAEVECALGRVAVRGAPGATLLLRPEQLRVRQDGPGVAARVITRRWLGPTEELTLELASGEPLCARQPPELLPAAAREVRVVVEGAGSCLVP